MRTIVVSTVAGAAMTTLLGCGRFPGPVPSPTPFVVPSPPVGAAECPAATGEAELLSQLAKGRVHVSSAGASTMQPVFKTTAVVCFMQTSEGSFEAAFFSDASTAAALHVCLTLSGSRYLYRVNDQTVDSAEPLYWTAAGAVIVWTGVAQLDAAFKRILGANTPSC
jgi:hypothetical protein